MSFHLKWSFLIKKIEMLSSALSLFSQNEIFGWDLMQTHTALNNPPKNFCAGKKDVEKKYWKISTAATTKPQSARYGCFVCGLSSYPSIDICVYLLFRARLRTSSGKLWCNKTRNGRYRTCNPEHEKDCSSILKNSGEKLIKKMRACA